MIEIKIRFKSGEIAYFKPIEDNIKDTFDVLGDVIREGVGGVLEVIDLADDKRTIINVSDISSFGYSEVE